jgi:hypothetical protein
MKNKEETKTDIVAGLSIPFWIRVFTALLIMGIISGALRAWALGPIKGHESIYIEYAIAFILNSVLLYGISTRKSWVRLLTVVVCLIMAVLVLVDLPVTSPATYVAIIRDLPFAAYFLFSKKAKWYFGEL